MSDSTNIVLDFSPDGKLGTGVLTAKYGTDMLAVDRLNITSSKQRDAFVAQLTKDRPGIDAKTVQAELLGLAGDATKPSAASPPQTDELDVSCVVRPELFHTEAVSGVTVSCVKLRGGKPRGEWLMCLRWHADGKREQRELSDSIELPNGERLWVWPQPGEPPPTHRPGWRTSARKAWLDGRVTLEPADVFKQICERIAWFLDFPPDLAPGATAVLALWAMFTYAYPVWSSVPYLSIGGPLSSGKTTLFKVLARLCFRPLESSNLTAACLFRTLHDCGGTLLLDESERLRDGSPEATELRSVLLSGYKRGSPAIRLEKSGDGFRRMEFDVFGPKGLAAVSHLPEALASRCIRLVMFRAGVESPRPRRRLDSEPGKWAALRDDLHALALEHGSVWLQIAQRDDVCPATFNGREIELWQPLLALAMWLDEAGADGLLEVVSGFADKATEASHDDSVPDCDETVLRILAAHVRGGTAATLKAGDILEAAREADPATFGTKDRPKWSPKGVANALRRYGLATRRGTGNRGRTYSAVTLDDLQRIEQVYGFDLGLGGSDVSHIAHVSRGSA